MPIEIKELIVRAWVGSQNGEKKHEAKKVAKTAQEVPEMQAELLEQMRKKITDKKDR